MKAKTNPPDQNQELIGRAENSISKSLSDVNTMFGDHRNDFYI